MRLEPQREIVRVLLVEHDEQGAVLLQRALASTRWPVRLAQSTAEAVEGATAGEFDCAVVDARLPDGTAESLAVALRRSLGETFPIILLSDGAPEDQAAVESLHTGFQDVIFRAQLTPSELRRSIRLAVQTSQVADLRRRLAHADRLSALGQLAAGIAHEINNPAAFILANLEVLAALTGELMKLERDPEALAARFREAGREAGELIADSVEGIDRISTIASRLRSFARKDRGHVGPVALNQVVLNSIKLVRNRIRHRAHLERDLQDVPLILADSGKLEQVVVNLLVNALQALESAPGSGLGTIRVRTAPDGERMVRLTVEDDGPGMSEDVQARAFEAFFTTKPPGLGTGIGLALCREIIESHHGHIELSSAPGEGARFDICLPTDASASLEQVFTPLREQSVVDARRRVLLVDDEVRLLEAYQRMFRSVFELVTCNGARAATELLGHDTDFDAILCDVMMPDMNGVDLYEWIGRECPQLQDRVLFHTGGVFDPTLRQRAEATGAPFVSKPASLMEIRAAVEAIERGGG